MQTKDLGRVNKWQLIDGFPELLQITALGDAVPFVEGEGLCKHVLTKPDLEENGGWTLTHLYPHLPVDLLVAMYACIPWRKY